MSDVADTLAEAPPPPPPEPPAAAASPRALGRLRARLEPLVRLAERHQALFWALHSLWALGWGIALMAAGAKRPQLLRLGLASVGAVWVSSLVLPLLLSSSLLPAGRKEAARKAVLYGQKWLLQGLAFFVLPLYHRSATYPSRNTLFMALLACAALAATIDVVYDEVVARRPLLLGAFLAFLAFSVASLTLPMVFRIGGVASLAASGGLATAVFASFTLRPHGGRPAREALRVAAVASGFLALVAFGRATVPPAPLCLVNAAFGTALAPGGLGVSAPLQAFPEARELKAHCVAAVRAPAGLQDGVRHVWSVDGRRVYESRVIGLLGGRALGFRSRSTVTLRGLASGQRVRVDVETAWGQLIGRAELPVRAAAPSAGEGREVRGEHRPVEPR